VTHEKKARLIAAVGSRIVRLLLLTLRLRVEDRGGAFQLPMTRPLLWAFWHNRLLLVPYLFEHYFPRRPGAALTSASKDGEILAAFIECFGVGAVRGSSSRGGARALVEMKRRVEADSMMAITPDGPRGPRYRLNPGLVKLAQITGGVIMPVRIEYSRYWELKSWDAFRIPRPFSKVTVVFDAPQPARETADGESFEAERARLEQWLLADHAPVHDAH
jgi:lysophospholipid acyltransferase (LPLAT)-like uncharacterized protein